MIQRHTATHKLCTDTATETATHSDTELHTGTHSYTHTATHGHTATHTYRCSDTQKHRCAQTTDRHTLTLTHVQARVCTHTCTQHPGGPDSKQSTPSAGDLGSIPGSGRSPGGGHGNPLRYSCLGNPMDRGAWRAAVHGEAKNEQLTLFHFTHTDTERHKHKDTQKNTHIDT